jgi:methyltransferase
MASVIAYTLLIVLTGVERLWELIVSKRNAATAFALGGIEVGKAHFPWMVALHTGLLVGCLVEVWWLQRDFPGALGWAMLAVALACQAGRYLIIHTLGSQWNTRVIVVPGAPRVQRGIYALPWLRHPNYWLVAIEGVALPLVHGAWITAVSFTLLNALLLLGFRIPVENKALELLGR